MITQLIKSDPRLEAWALQAEPSPLEVAARALLPELRSMTRELASKPRPGPEYLGLKDFEGFDMGNYPWFMTGYVPIMMLPSTSLAIHAEAAQRLILHSKQLPKGYPQCIAKVLGEASGFAYQKGKHKVKEGEEKREQVSHRVADPTQAKMRDGSAWEFDPQAGNVFVLCPRKRTGKSVNDLLNAANLSKGPDYGWTKRGNEWWLRVSLKKAAAIFAALEPNYPDLSKAAVNALPAWQEMVAEIKKEFTAAEDLAEVEALAQVERGKTKAVEAAYSPEQGTFAGVSWEWRKETEPFSVYILWVGAYVSDPLKAAGVAFNFDKRNGKTGVEYWIKLPVTESEKAIRAMAVDFSKFAKLAITSFIPVWTEKKSSLVQSKDAGSCEEGSWRLMPDGKTVRLETVFKPNSKWRDPVKNFVSGTKEGGKFYWEFKVRRARKVADALRADYPRLAEALYRAYGGVATMVEDEDKIRCEALVELSDAAETTDVKHPLAISTLKAIDAKLSTRLPIGLTLSPYQIIGVAFAEITGYRCIIGDEQGVGKTMQGIGALISDPETLLPALIVCPASVYGSWKKELQKWAPSLPVYALETINTPLPPKKWRGVLLCTWALLSDHSTALYEWGLKTIIADEAHYAKESSSQRSKALALLSTVVPHLLFMSGTPLKNRAIELWALLHLLAPDEWGDKSAFGEAYSNVEVIVTPDGKAITKYGGGVNLEDLRTRLRCFMVRRLKEQVLKQLPPKRREYMEVELSRKERQEYDAAEAEFERWLESAVELKTMAEFQEQGIDPLSVSEEIRATVTERVERSMKAEALVKLGVLRRLVGRAKVAPAIKFIEEMTDQDRRLVVVVDTVDVGNDICAAMDKRGISYGKITGETPKPKRDGLIEKFQAGDLSVMLLSQAGKEGITLTRAADTLFVERFWTPGDEEQMEDRIHRRGQDHGVTIWYLLARSTVDERMSALIEDKRAIIKGAIGSASIVSGNMKASGSTDDVIGGLVKAYLKKKKPEFHIPVQGSRKENPSRGQEKVTKLPPLESIQSLIFLRPTWTEKTARFYVKTVMKMVAHPRELQQSISFEQYPTREFRNLRVVKLTETIKALVGERR